MTRERRKRSGTYVKPTIISDASSPGAPPTPAEAERARLRLEHLVEIGRLLLQLDTVEGTVDQALLVASRTLPLRTAVLITESEVTPKMVSWGHASPADLEAAKHHAEVAYAYLTGGSSTDLALLDEPGPSELPDGVTPEPQPASHRYILIPLVVDHEPIFGALQVEAARPFDKTDLVFVNEVANQLAIAIARRRAWRRDIERRERTERRLLEAELREAASQVERGNATAVAESYASLVDNLNKAFVWEADAATCRIFYTSAGAEPLLGYERRLDESDSWLNSVHPDDRAEVMAQLRACAADRSDRRFHHRCITADGRQLWLNTGIHYSDQPSGAILQGVSFDVTTVRSDDAHVREQLDFTRAVATNLGECVLAVDTNHRVTFLNEAAEQLLGSSAADAHGAPLASILTLIDRDGHIPLDAFGNGEIDATLKRDDLTCLRKDGSSFPISYSASPIRVGGERVGSLLAFHDVTERKVAEATLAEAVRTREQILAIVAHDLRNPLGVIRMSAAVLRKTTPVDPLERKSVEIIERSAQRMGRLIDDLADFTNIQAGRLRTQRQPEAVADLLTEATASLAPLARERDIDLRGELHGSPPDVTCDRDRILQVFSNIAGNAIKLTPAGGSIVLAAEQTEEGVVFSIADTGPGISQHDLQRIFERYWRGEGARYAGSGLGLAIARGIVQAHGGRIWAESSIGVGTTFHFVIPVAQPVWALGG